MQRPEPMISGVEKLNTVKKRDSLSARNGGRQLMKKSILSVALIGGLTVTGLGTHQAQAASGASVVNAAEQGVGSSYTWGQNDCSGFTQRVFSKLGVQLPHSSAGQAGYGTAVSRDHLQPGDLVFFNTSGSGISHVGIYVGNNRMISAETEKTGVRETQIFGGGASSYWEPRYVTARRVVAGQAVSQPQATESTPAPSTASAPAASPAPESSNSDKAASTTAASTTHVSQPSSAQPSGAKNQTSDEQKRTPVARPSSSAQQQTTQAAKSSDSEKTPSAPSAPVRQPSASASATSQETAKSGSYIVRVGDTLWEISNQNGISVQKLQRLNDLTDTMIHPGQKLNLQDPDQTYTIKPGDSLWTIAVAHGTTVEQLMKANHLDSDLIYPEDHLTIK